METEGILDFGVEPDAEPDARVKPDNESQFDVETDAVPDNGVESDGGLEVGMKVVVLDSGVKADTRLEADVEADTELDIG